MQIESAVQTVTKVLFIFEQREDLSNVSPSAAERKPTSDLNITVYDPAVLIL